MPCEGCPPLGLAGKATRGWASLHCWRSRVLPWQKRKKQGRWLLRGAILPSSPAVRAPKQRGLPSSRQAQGGHPVGPLQTCAGRTVEVWRDEYQMGLMFSVHRPMQALSRSVLMCAGECSPQDVKGNMRSLQSIAPALLQPRGCLQGWCQRLQRHPQEDSHLEHQLLESHARCQGAPQWSSVSIRTRPSDLPGQMVKEPTPARHVCNGSHHRKLLLPLPLQRPQQEARAWLGSEPAPLFLVAWKTF
mmetsp:Transcript_43643/g.102947  ORF Transcript_43643/g.102947 Transcript_43643/m.102947 type:complete len:246 (-) Transcript_43643:961-1698(-)